MVNLWQNDISRNISWSSPPSKLVKREADGRWVYVSLSSSDYSAIQSALYALFSANTEVRPVPSGGISKWDMYYHGSYLDSGVLQPNVEILRTRERVPTKNKNFSRLSKSGKIVVAPFESTVECKIVVTPPSEDTVISTGSRWLDLPKPFGPVSDPLGGSQSCFVVNGITYRGGRVLSPTRKISRVYTTENTCGYDPDEHINRILQRWDELGPSSPSALNVQSALSEANNGQYAILATLAEIPEGWIGALSGVKKCLQMYKEAQAKDFRLHNKLSKLRKIQNPTLAVRKEIDSLVSAVADIWLTYRLAIKPTVGAIEDWLALDTNPELPLYQRFRSLEQSSFDLGFDSTHNVMCIERAFIKRRYDTFIASLGWGSLSAVWELVPLSFVVDRFIDIGEFITAHTSPNLSVDEGNTYSWKVNSGTSFPICNNRTVSVSFSGYKRILINPYHYCGLSYPETRSFSQSADHAALAWKIFISDLFTHKRAGT